MSRADEILNHTILLLKVDEDEEAFHRLLDRPAHEIAALCIAACKRIAKAEETTK